MSAAILVAETQGQRAEPKQRKDASFDIVVDEQLFLF
jgi:hypothetical protein